MLSKNCSRTNNQDVSSLRHCIFALLLCALCSHVLPDYSAVVHKAAGPVTIDGGLDDTAWPGAQTLSDFIFPWGNDRGTRSEVRVLWDDSAFFTGGRMFDSKITSGTAIDGDDMFEMHISPDTALADYFYILEFNLHRIYRARLRKSRPDGRNEWWEEWDITGLSNEITVLGTANDASDTDSAWVVEFRLPFALLAGWQGTGHTAPAGWNPAVPPVDGSAWRFNITRLNYDTHDGTYDFSTWSHNGSYVSTAGYEPHFHNHNNFGTLHFSAATRVRPPGRPGGLKVPALEVRPNPFSARVELAVRGLSAQEIQKGKWRIHDVHGRRIGRPAPGNVFSFRPAPCLPAGLYFATFAMPRRSLTRKLLLVR